MTNPQHEALVEAVARAIAKAHGGDVLPLPELWIAPDATSNMYRRLARAAIAALSATAATPSDEEVRLRAAVRFLLDWLVDHEVRMTSDEDAREWYGHVTPAMERARAALEPQGKDL